MTGSANRRAGVRSVERGILILRHLAEAGHDMALSDLAALVSMPASQVHRYLVSLCATGMVQQDPVSMRYDLSEGALQVGLASLGRIDAYKVARDRVVKLARKIGQTCFAATWGSAGPTVFTWADGPQPVSVNVRIGNVLPVEVSATGLVFSAWGTIDSKPSASSAAAARAKRHGVARVKGDFQPGIHALSGPVFDHEGRLTIAITTLGIRGEFDDRYDGAFAKALRETCNEASRALGYDISRCSPAQQSG